MKGWDYRSPGIYFVTICTKGKVCWFGNISNEKINLSEIGKIALKNWIDIPHHFPFVSLDEFQIMPNHIHGIVQITSSSVATRHVASLQNEKQANRFGPLIPNSLQSIIHQYKSSVTRWCRKNEFEDFRWQPRFYEQRIRNDKDLHRIQRYIRYNPRNWKEDEDYFDPLSE